MLQAWGFFCLLHGGLHTLCDKIRNSTLPLKKALCAKRSNRSQQARKKLLSKLKSYSIIAQKR